MNKDTLVVSAIIVSKLLTRLPMKRGELPEIQKLLGHSNIITTQRYSHLDQNDKSIPANMIETKFNMSFILNDNKKEQISIGTR